jgi:hypothetical protein
MVRLNMNAYNPNRINENKAAPYRSDRFYCVNDEWYFAIRRGPDQGPYPSKESALAALKKFIAEELALERRLEAERQSQGTLFRPLYRP